MADMNFGVNLLPVSSDAYNLGTNTKKWNNLYAKNLNGTSVDSILSSLNATRVKAETARWLRFDPNNRRGLVIKAGTYILKNNGEVQAYTEDTHIDLTNKIGQPGKDYKIYLSDYGTFDVSEDEIDGNNLLKIGRFHTLCANVGTINNMIVPDWVPSNTTTDEYYLVKGYREDLDPDFYSFYNKLTGNITSQTQYNVVTCPHPLSGFLAGDILPESVFCLTFQPDTLYEDAMVYDADTDRCVDIYLQSGAAHLTRSAYNATHMVSRSPINHQEDMRIVGKRLLRDYEFTSAAIGSNEKTNISGSSDKTYVGGHSDTNNRRMISAIGCEEMCGYLWQWLDEIAPVGGSKWETDVDGHDSFGSNYGIPYVLRAGGDWIGSSHCGSRSRTADCSRARVSAACSGRGSSRVKRGL